MTENKERYREIIQRKLERNYTRAIVSARNNGICASCLKNLAFPGRALCKDCLNKDIVTRRNE